MKRLPFALLALSFSVPVVACLNAATDGEAASDALSDATTKACNFNYTPITSAADQTISAAKSQGLATGSRILLGDIDGDGKIDFATADSAGVQVFKGSGDGHFKAGTKTAIPVADTTRTRVALATVAIGDFDGDGHKDVVLLDTTADANNVMRGDYSVVYGQKDGSLAIGGDATALGSITAATFYHVAGDLDGDGADDLAYTTLTGDVIVFGSKDKKLVAGKTGIPGTATRGLAFIQPGAGTKPASLVVQTTGNVYSLTFDKTTRKASSSIADSAAIPNGDSRFGTDLDSNGQYEITTLGTEGLTIKPVGGGAAFSIASFPGRAIGSWDLAGSKMNELVYIVNESKVYAACGYAANGQDIGSVALPITYGNGTFIAGTSDINGDKQADFLTIDTNGNLQVYLGAGQATPAPQVSVFSNAHPSGDASADGASDATTDASTHDGSTDASAESDASTSDASTTDAGTGGHDGGGGHHDAGASTNGNNSTGSEAPPAEEGSGLGDPGGDGSQSNPSSGGTDPGEGPPAAIPPPQTVSSCSATPGTSGVTGSAFGGLFAAMMLLVRRRRSSSQR